MSLRPIRERLAGTPAFASFVQQATALSAGRTLRLRGAAGSLPAFALAHLAEQRPRPVLCLLPEHEAANYLRSDLDQALGAEHVLLFPPTGHHPYDPEQVAETVPLVTRADALEQLASGFEGVVVTSVEAVMERVPERQAVSQETLVLTAGDTVPPEDLVERLIGQGFQAVEFVAAPGEFALRGGLLDVYPFAGDYPVRIEFFGDDVDSLREFDPQSQRSVSRLTQARLVPNLGTAESSGGAHTSLFDHLPDNVLIATFDEQRFEELAAQRFENAREAFDARGNAGLPPPEALYMPHQELRAALAERPRLLFGTFAEGGDESLDFGARPQPPFNGDIRALRDHFHAVQRQGGQAYLLCDSRGQLVRLEQILAEEDREPPARLDVESLHEGFELPRQRLFVYTDHQLFNRYHRPTARKRKGQTGLSLRELRALSPGDFVVHVDHGIGQFAGLQTITVREKRQEAAKLVFKGGDELFVSVNALHKLHKYTGKEGTQPALTKLGSGQWEKTKARTKKRVKDIARDLVKVYAKRKESPGFGFSSDTIWQRELEASFAYVDTPDQAAAAEAVKEDMQDHSPMDRLVCGDVGFGKTEIAVRAAFKAVQDGKQVAVLVPTTILASQHYETFSERFERFPVRIAQLSRFVSADEQKAVRAAMKSGNVDIVIGTQRLASKNMEFKDLGLLIIDEEQRFGVTVKERLRQLRATIDTLTLTATPIPRTLQFSLLGVRDLSIISTPPPNRQPVQTEIHTFSKDLIRDAILYEVNRGGQAFFLHNRVRDIEEVASLIRGLVPGVRIRVAHGQMPASELESVVLDFIHNKFDVLVSTNIVESGIDVGNANTIIINHAERHGLADLHQLRGRVGRRDQKAFCYLLVPSIHALTREARMRLQAIEEFADLGSGFNIAMRDLDIRGAGAMLGAEQSGFIEDLGYETYHKLLEEAVEELRQEEFAELFAAKAPPTPEPTVDVEEDALLPDDYVSNNTERMNLYRRLADLAEPEAIAALREELADRFGPVPAEVDNLLLGASMKAKAQQLRLTRVSFRNQRLFLEVPKPEADPYFYEHVFNPLLERLGKLSKRYVLKDSKAGRLRAIVQDVQDLRTGAAILEQLTREPLPVPAEATA